MSTTAVERRQPLRPLDVQETKAAMHRYQEGLHSILAKRDWQEFPDRKGGVSRFVKRSGWRKIATWFELDLETRTIEVERNEKGDPIRARVTARAIAPNRRYADAIGACSIRERGFTKPEHDIQATAETRATNRAISNLVGLGEVSAEELDGAIPALEPPRWGVEADRQWQAKAFEAVTQALRPERDPRGFMRVLVNRFEGKLPEAAAMTLDALRWWAQDHPEPIAEPVPAATGEPESVAADKTDEGSHQNAD